MGHRLSRRHLLVSAAGLGVAACSTELKKASPFWSTMTNSRPKQSDADIRAYAASLPFDSMLVWFDGQSRALTVLTRVEPEERLLWITSDKQTITTFGPFVVGAIGTEVELRSTKFSPGWSTDIRTMIGKSLSRQTVVAHRGQEATATLKSTFSDGGLTKIDLLGVEKTARRINETMIADNRVRIGNSYWVDPDTGDWIKTHQQVIPMMAPVNTAVLRPVRA